MGNHSSAWLDINDKTEVRWIVCDDRVKSGDIIHIQPGVESELRRKGDIPNRDVIIEAVETEGLTNLARTEGGAVV